MLPLPLTFVDILSQQVQIPLRIPLEDVKDVVHKVIVLDRKLGGKTWKIFIIAQI
jgi:hypothetical protein